MSQTVKLATIFDAVTSLKDRSMKLTFVTRELNGMDSATLLSQLHNEGWLLFAPNENDIDAIDVPHTKADAGTGQKSSSQRLRAILFVYWRSLGEPGPFESFYIDRIERAIDQYKALVDKGERGL